MFGILIIAVMVLALGLGMAWNHRYTLLQGEANEGFGQQLVNLFKRYPTIYKKEDWGDDPATYRLLNNLAIAYYVCLLSLVFMLITQSIMGQ